MEAGKSNVQPMVCKVRCGKNIRGALNYNENKVKEGKAECIGAVNYVGEAQHMTFYEKLARFQNLKETQRAKTNTLHISLNFDVGEKLGQNKLKQIVTTYMDKIGFGAQPYLVYQHYDAAHPHLHIVTTNIQEDGRRIGTHNLGKSQSEMARQEIEVQFRLVKAQSKPKLDIDSLQKTVDKAVYGKSETKKAIDNIVGMVIRNYNYTSLMEFNAALRQFNVMADRGKEGTTMYQKNGLLYWILDDRGNKIGVPIKASALVPRPTMKNLQCKFQANGPLKPVYKDRLTTVIDSFFQVTDRHTRTNFCNYLNFHGINPVFRENKEGKVYGIIFIDNRKGAVINGSDLGKEYSGQALIKQFHARIAIGRVAGEKEREEWVQQRFELPEREPYSLSPANPMQSSAAQFLNFKKVEKYHSEPINPYLKRRKKRKRRLSR